MNVLSIGNSFSQDATRYLYEIAKKQGFKHFHSTNLFIGGCSLYTHFKNMHEDNFAYSLEVNGMSTGYAMSIKKALLSREWDVVTLQQVSHLSHNYATYEPYLSALIDCIRTYAPKAKIYIHETWAYEKDSARLLSLNFNTPEEMYNKVHESYLKAVEKADGIIPSGTLFMNILHNGIEKIHRDTFHTTLGLGRYALGLLWLHTLTGADITENTFAAFDEEISEEEIKLAKKCVMEL